jgi:hypothetical protein
LTLLSILFSLSFLTPKPDFQCMAEATHQASKVEILKGWKFTQTRGAPPRQVRYLVRQATEEDGTIDSRILAISWMESRLRIGVKRGDRGKACGIFQIHARHSYPLFRRKRGYRDWNESENVRQINAECRKLETTSYSINTMKRLLKMMDERDLHPCHHNSGIYGACNEWYRQRVDFWVNYFDFHKLKCDERVQALMAMLKTGNPIPTAPAPRMQGYLDGMAGKEPQQQDAVYKSGHDLALLVKEGKATPPAWAIEAVQGEG